MVSDGVARLNQTPEEVLFSAKIEQLVILEIRKLLLVFQNGDLCCEKAFDIARRSPSSPLDDLVLRLVVHVSDHCLTALQQSDRDS